MRRYVLILAFVLPAVACAQSTPLIRAHSHNDYRQPRPLLDALAYGFCSVEADIHLVDGELLVAHDPEECDPGRTLVGLYLAPLRERVLANGGRVYPGGPSLTLLIDIKTEAGPTYAALAALLAEYEEMLTIFEGDRVYEGAVTVIVSGNRDFESILGPERRLAAVDGRPEDLGGRSSAAEMPLVSAAWTDHFSWRGAGEMPPEELAELRRMVRRCHDEERRLRFWALPIAPAVWELVHAEGVDLINTDFPEALRNFLLAKGEGSAEEP